VRTIFQRLCWALLVLFAVGGAASAQDVVTISGVVTTRADGLSVPGAVISIVGADASAAVTDKDGKYSLQAPRSLVRGDRLQLKVDALGLPPTIVDVNVTASSVSS